MKKRRGVALLLVTGLMVAFIIFMPCGFALMSKTMFGDVNLDGSVSSVDARILLRCAARLELYNETTYNLCDLDGDGKYTSADARYLLRAVARILPYSREWGLSFDNALLHELSHQLIETEEAIDRKQGETFLAGAFDRGINSKSKWICSYDCVDGIVCSELNTDACEEWGVHKYEKLGFETQFFALQGAEPGKYRLCFELTNTETGEILDRIPLIFEIV